MKGVIVIVHPLEVGDALTGHGLPGGGVGHHEVGVDAPEGAHHQAGESQDEGVDQKEDVGFEPLAPVWPIDKCMPVKGKSFFLWHAIRVVFVLLVKP